MNIRRRDYVTDDTETVTAAKQLDGKVLQEGWTVVEKVLDHPNDTGGCFSTSYIVQAKSGKRAFLKAMDFSSALRSPDPATALEQLTSAFNYERNLLEKCRQRNLNRIVKVLDTGTITAQDGDPSSVVQYLIFELANGDIRSAADFGKELDEAWILRALHGITAALQQLHSANIAHQDLKPSNVLTFEHQLPRHRLKLADLGSASERDVSSPHDDFIHAGDLTYAPLEFLYGHTDPDWNTRRIGCDYYLLGSLIVFLYTGVSITHLILSRIDSEHNYRNWKGTYQDVLPYLQNVFAQFLRELEDNVWDEHSMELSRVVKELAHLDPTKRGHPKESETQNRHSLRRYVSIFDRLATKAEWSVKRNLIKRG